eukprot:scaffold59772_cov43-Cyclotella_meneghiniana.AAC.1
MAAVAAKGDFDMASPDFSHVFSGLTLNTVPCNFGDLTPRQQRKQMSPPFEAHGLHWVLVVEKYANEDGSFDVHVFMHCLSVSITEEQRTKFVIKGDISSGDHVFNGRLGQVFNLPGESFPAQALRFMNRVLFRLRSGNINEEMESSTWSQANERGFSFGGYYDGDWNSGIGGCMLKNHHPCSCVDDTQIEISVKFELPAPQAVIDFEQSTEKAQHNNGSMKIDDNSDGDYPMNIWEKIVHNAESCSEEDDSFIDEMETDDILTDDDDDELEYDTDNDRDLYDSQMKQSGYKSESLAVTLGEDSKALLIWREGLFSDWIINVTSESEEGSETATRYNVHRVALATGPKKSGYFETLLSSSQSFSENSASMSTVTLPAKIAAQFPEFLDYLYSQPVESKIIITSENWRSMKYLATYFLVPALLEDVSKFVEDNMYNLDIMVECLSEFNDFDDDISKCIIPKAVRVCAEMIQSIEISSQLIQTISPAMFLSIISTLSSSKCFGTASNDERHHVCRLIIGYLERIEDERYLSTLSSAMGLVLFPGDNVVLSGELALDLLAFIQRKGWKDDWIIFVCTSFLGRYLASHPRKKNLVARVVRGVHADVVTTLFRGALLAERIAKKPNNVQGLRFKVVAMLHNGATLWKYGGPYVIRTLPPVDPTETISQLKISIARSLGLLSSSFIMVLKHNAVKMNDEEKISFYKVKDNDLLDVIVRVIKVYLETYVDVNDMLSYDEESNDGE